MGDRRFAWALACAGVLAANRAAATLPGSGADDRGDRNHHRRWDHDDTRFARLALGDDAGLE